MDDKTSLLTQLRIDRSNEIDDDGAKRWLRACGGSCSGRAAYR